MNTEEVLAKLQWVFDQVLVERVVIRPELESKDVSEWDSLVHISLVHSIEQAFGIRFRVGEVESTENIGELAELIMKRLAG
jgi:acyl carrier protein